MTDLENPFVSEGPFFSKEPVSSKNMTLKEIAAEANANSLRLLLTTVQTVRDTLAHLEKAVPGTVLHHAWKTKLEAARNDFHAIALSFGMSEGEVEVALQSGKAPIGKK